MSIRTGLIFGIAAALLVTGSSAGAQVLQPLSLEGNVERGAGLAYTCSGCHGVDGAVNVYPTYHVPKLGGQNADYVEIALQAYRDGSRAHPTMHAQATQLSDQDIADVAAYFASIEAAPRTGVSSASAADILAGQEKSTTCQACHGAAGIAQSAQWPNLAGQHASYLLEAMLQYQQGDRAAPVMAPLVGQLDGETLEQIAAYYAAQEGLHPTGR